MTAHTLLETPVGTLTLEGTGEVLEGLWFDGPPAKRVLGPRDDGILVGARAQLTEYFAGEREAFDLELAPHGTPFQRSVWDALARIPYGRTTSYGELALALGSPRAVRAVGLANGRNPLSIVVPCHRVVGADGALTGYAGGLWRKRFLLALEEPAADEAGRLF